ncbi:MAG: porin family protein [Bacteroidia bacterium]
MPRKIFAFIFFLQPLLSAAQADFGIKAGGNAYIISSSLPSTYTFHWQAGFFSKANINDKFALQPELLYTIKGSHVTLNNTTINIKLNYVELPLVASYKFYKKMFAEAGFDISYLAKVQKTNSTDTLLKPSAFSPFSFGLLFGTGIELKSFDITLRYDLGLTKLILESDPANENNPLVNSHNRGFQISIGFVL